MLNFERGMQRWSIRNCDANGMRAATAQATDLRRLGSSNLRVPSLCLGTMLFGESTEYNTACHLMNKCLERGVNFFDTAEMYPVPQASETQGASEKMLGDWLKSKDRSKIIISTKVSGPSGQMTWIRGGPMKVDAKNIASAIEGSLMRLGTDYIDLYQIHWPDRYVPMFGDVDYRTTYAYSEAVPLEVQLEALGRAVREGKILHVGLSNETAWGLMKCLHAAKQQVSDQPSFLLPRVASLQNAYNLLCRTFDAHLAECCHLEGVSLLAYSPLAMGLLTGKYNVPGAAGADARLIKYKGRYAEAESRYGMRPNVLSALKAYSDLAAEAGISPTEMALRFVLSHPLIASVVIGATSMDQLKEQLAAAEAGPLGEDLLMKIDEVHSMLPNPAP
ncbi:hypothetical protein CEUSTIGMA_g9589.t1 [Chlamydomonas eustigma]|uniref:NADP-dependent oxidoreductase domain-containing protein n=1 Tax=Chlamydomonas eustigma TaxID=1157962 RepID=A0A250XGF5_9CHLO|nr:hypothetical protein CEUSTIGMA_g9589.t1 [Chlamydomonas eustigma]|eukprot:GAX82161.1 hypothetical protein CEUSTIGMA_g9589.t1 [Chlamydomonas eustigma]